VCATTEGHRTLEALNRSGSDLREGDRVEVRVSASAAVQASFLVLIVPLAMFVLFYFLVQRGIPSAGEGLRVLAGVGGLGAGFGVNFLVRGKHRDLPVIVAREAVRPPD
jgi:positive regulator of sigma E activity